MVDVAARGDAATVNFECRHNSSSSVQCKQINSTTTITKGLRSLNNDTAQFPLAGQNAVVVRGDKFRIKLSQYTVEKDKMFSQILRFL